MPVYDYSCFFDSDLLKIEGDDIDTSNGNRFAGTIEQFIEAYMFFATSDCFGGMTICLQDIIEALGAKPNNRRFAEKVKTAFQNVTNLEWRAGKDTLPCLISGCKEVGKTAGMISPIRIIAAREHFDFKEQKLSGKVFVGVKMSVFQKIIRMAKKGKYTADVLLWYYLSMASCFFNFNYRGEWFKGRAIPLGAALSRLGITEYAFTKLRAAMNEADLIYWFPTEEKLASVYSTENNREVIRLALENYAEYRMKNGSHALENWRKRSYSSFFEDKGKTVSVSRKAYDARQRKIAKMEINREFISETDLSQEAVNSFTI